MEISSLSGSKIGRAARLAHAEELNREIHRLLANVDYAQREELWCALLDGRCRHCGDDTTEHACYCMNDD